MKRVKPATKRQMNVLRYIRSFQKKNLYSPSIREIAYAFCVEHNAIAKTIRYLMRRDLLELTPHGRIKFPRGTIVPQP